MVPGDGSLVALEALVVEVPQVPGQAAALGEELALAEDAVEHPLDAALVLQVTDEIALGHVRLGATHALPFAAGVPWLAAHGAAVAVQGEYVGVALTAARAHVRLVRFRQPGGRALKQQLRILRATYPRVKRRRRAVGEVRGERQVRLRVHPEIGLALT